MESEAELSAETAAEEIEAASEEPFTMKIAYRVTGERHKALVKAASSFNDKTAKYQNAPTFVVMFV